MIGIPKNPIIDVLKNVKNPATAKGVSQQPINTDEHVQQFESPEQKFQREFVEAQQKPTDVVAQGFLKGVEPSFPVFDAQEFDRQSSALGMSENNALKDALAKRAQKHIDTAMGGIKRDAEMAGFERRSKGLATAGEVLANQKAIRDQYDAMEYQRKQAEKQARNSVISTVLMVAGTAAGGLLAGPAGAMAGSAVGSGLGQAAGGMS